MCFSVVHWYVNSFYTLSADMLFKPPFFSPRVSANDTVYLDNWNLSSISLPKNFSLWEELQSSVKPTLNVDCIQQNSFTYRIDNTSESLKKGKQAVFFLYKD